jgi:hypothetical protein
MMLNLAMTLLLATLSATPDLTQNASPILVELFTSEGCSSCPPADRLLQQLDQSQSIGGAQVIVLSEHVDYWNSIGWKDPYSSEFFSKRQGAYASHFGTSSVYTPQMVVDGSAEFVGSDSNLANRALEKARSAAKISLQLSSVTVEKGTLRAHVLAEVSPKPADVFFVIALSHAESQVSRGENSGRHLTHVAVVQQLEKIGSMEPGKEFVKDVELKLPPGADSSNLRAIAFIQEFGPGRVLGATLKRLQK